MSIKIDLRISPWKFYELHGVDGKASANALAEIIRNRILERFPGVDVTVSVDPTSAEDELAVFGKGYDEDEDLLGEVLSIIDNAYDEFEWIPLKPQTGASKVITTSSQQIVEMASSNNVVVLIGWEVFPALVDIAIPTQGITVESVPVWEGDYGAFVPMARGIIRGQFPNARGEVIDDMISLSMARSAVEATDESESKALPIAAYDPQSDTLYVAVDEDGWPIAEDVYLYFLGLPPDWRPDTPAGSEKEE